VLDPPSSASGHIWRSLAMARAVQRLSKYPFVLLTDVAALPDGTRVAEPFRALGAQVLPLREVPLPRGLPRPGGSSGGPLLGLQRLQLWRLEEFERLIWLDTSAVLFRSLDWLFDRAPVWAQQQGSACADEGGRGSSDGLLYIEPSAKDLDGLLALAAETPSERWLSSGVSGLVRHYFAKTGSPVELVSTMDASSHDCLNQTSALPRRSWRSMPALIYQHPERRACLGFDVRQQLLTTRGQETNICHHDPLGAYWRDLFCDALRVAKSAPDGADDYCDDEQWYHSAGSAEPWEPLPGAARPAVTRPTALAGTTTTTAAAAGPAPRTADLAGVCSPAVEPVVLGPPPIFDVARDVNEHCFDLVSGSLPELTRGGRGQRNWCWVGLKASGCHAHLFEHLGWRTERDMAVEAQLTVEGDFDPLQNPGLCDLPELGVAPEWSSDELQEASEWFNRTVSVFVLSLHPSKKRRKLVEEQWRFLGISHTVVWGVDLREHGAMDGARREGLIPESYNMTLAQLRASDADNNMGVDGGIAGTVGCAAGHFRVQRRAAEVAARYPLSVIFEDDVKPADDFVPRLWQLVTKELPCDWQVVSLASRCPFGTCVSPHLSRVQPDVNEPVERCHHGVNYGFQGVLYRAAEIPNVQQVWQPVVFDSERPHCIDVDVALASISDKVAFYAVPASQDPGLLEEMWELGSTRINVNKEQTIS